MDNIQVLVEFTGISRVLTGRTEIPLLLTRGADLRDVIRSISHKFPSLIGEVIRKDGKSLIPTNLFSINGKQILQEEHLQYQPKDSDCLILLSLLAGG
ncbi:MAG: MoaD/ThiS family protein [Anaerolineaceae bacterium]|nr:MoaD/ThiS family protein [Anaerolineaceae bacterium]